MGKVIFLDVDGTLVDYENHLPPSAVSAIRRARSLGHQVYLCTGRSIVEIEPKLWNIGLDGIIGGNGCYIEDHGQVLYHRTLTMEECARIVEWLHKRKLEFYLESNNGLFASEHFEEAVYFAFPLHGGKHAEARSIFPEMSFGESLCRDDINKVSFLPSRHQDYLDAEVAFKDLSVSLWDETETAPLLVSLGAKDVDKAAAVEILVKHLGTDLQDTIAFGDAGVDIPMLVRCGYGVAMGNGSSEIKATADYVTAPVDQDGLYFAFETLGLIAKSRLGEFAMKKFECTITDPVGIHARPAGLLAKAAKAVDSTVTITKADGKSAEAKKLMAVMGLGVKAGETVTFTIDGGDEDASAAAMEQFCKDNM